MLTFDLPLFSQAGWALASVDSVTGSSPRGGCGRRSRSCRASPAPFIRSSAQTSSSSWESPWTETPVCPSSSATTATLSSTSATASCWTSGTESTWRPSPETGERRHVSPRSQEHNSFMLEYMSCSFKSVHRQYICYSQKIKIIPPAMTCETRVKQSYCLFQEQHWMPVVTGRHHFIPWVHVHRHASVIAVFLSYPSRLRQGRTSHQTDAVCTVWCRGLTVTRRAAVPAPTCRRCWRVSVEGLWRWCGVVWTVTRMWWTPAALRPDQTPDRHPLKLNVTTEQKETKTATGRRRERTASTRPDQVKLPHLRITAALRRAQHKVRRQRNDRKNNWAGSWFKAFSFCNICNKSGIFDCLIFEKNKTKNFIPPNMP